MEIKFGLDTFGDMQVDDSGSPITAAQTIRNVVEQAVLADSLGIYGINLGEHHRDDFAISAPDTILAGIATKTAKIKLGTGVTVLSSDDSVRVYQRFATIDALSNGRAEITAGRGSFIESFPLFGFDLSQYEVLFEEKLELLVELLKEKPVTWSGSTRLPLNNQQVYPKTENGEIPLRVGVGGTPASVVRAARLNLQLALAIIGGDPARFAAFSNLYRQSMQEFGHPLKDISIHSPGHIAVTDEQCAKNFEGKIWPRFVSAFEKADGPRFGIVDFAFINKEGSIKKILIIVSWCSDKIGARVKMTFASTRTSFENKVNIGRKFGCNDISELEYNNVKTNVIDRI